MLLFEYAKNVRQALLNLQREKYYEYTEDQLIAELSNWFQRNLGYPLDLENPQTFNQKIQWLKLYDSTIEKARLADKLRVREWISHKIGEDYLIPLIGEYKTFDEVDFSILPNSFVMKTNHASSTNIIVRNKSTLNIHETRLKFTKWLKTNYAFKMGFELQYGMIPPRIICEQFMGENLNDYKFFCFGGEPSFIWVDVGRYTNHCRNTYDLQWNELPFIIDQFKRIYVEKPHNLKLMEELARELSKGFAFVRVDFYEIDGKVYFGEMTFTSSSGRDAFHPKEYDGICGKKIVLPEKKPIPLDEIRRIWHRE